jgi:hypothetical protein
MARKGQVVHVRGAGGTWLISAEGTVSFTGVAWDQWMVWGEFDEGLSSNCWASALGATYAIWLVTVTADGAVTLHAVDHEHTLVALKIS